MNSVFITGRLGGDPEVRATADGTKIANFSVADDAGYGKNKKTLWHKIVAFGNQAGPIETYLRKGDKVAISGHLNYRTYDKEPKRRQTATPERNSLSK